jgi:pyruvate/2-oxoacid:ferredoxin oxidoreductase alpha subunit
MARGKRITVDANEAAASVAFRVSEAIAIYPITPSSPMAELCDEMRGNMGFGRIPDPAAYERASFRAMSR